MEEMIKNLGNRMVLLLRIINVDRIKWNSNTDNLVHQKPLNKFDHELNGMIMAIQAMGISFSFEFDAKSIEYKSVTLMGIQFII